MQDLVSKILSSAKMIKEDEPFFDQQRLALSHVTAQLGPPRDHDNSPACNLARRSIDGCSSR